MISVYLFDYFILCVLCTALEGQALTVLVLRIGTHYWHRKKNKVSNCLWFHHQWHSIFCTVECLLSSLSSILFLVVCLHALRNKDQKGILAQSVPSSMEKEITKIQAAANACPLVKQCLNAPRAARRIGMFVYPVRLWYALDVPCFHHFLTFSFNSLFLLSASNNMNS